MIVVVDNDVMQALASWDLLGDLPGIFNVEPADLRVLDTARFRYQVKNPEKGRLKFGEAWDRIAAFLSTTPTVTTADAEDMEAAANVVNFDDGELVLFSFASRTPDSIIITGDKRALEAVAKTATLQPMRERLAGRVVSLEQVLQRLFAKRGFEAVRDAVVTSSTTHMTARVVFGSGLLTTADSAHAALTSYFGQLVRLVPDLMLVDAHPSPNPPDDTG